MKRLNNNNFYVLVAALFVSLLSFNAISAQGFKKNSQELLIQVDIRGCAFDVKLEDSSQDNCEGSDLQNSCGKNGKDCVCMTNQKFIKWTTSNGSPFELVFDGDAPFSNNCGLKSKNKKSIRCKIDSADGEFIYEVVVKSCPEQTYDPRIVVRT